MVIWLLLKFRVVRCTKCPRIYAKRWVLIKRCSCYGKTLLLSRGTNLSVGLKMPSKLKPGLAGSGERARNCSKESGARVAGKAVLIAQISRLVRRCNGCWTNNLKSHHLSLRRHHLTISATTSFQIEGSRSTKEKRSLRWAFFFGRPKPAIFIES